MVAYRAQDDGVAALSQSDLNSWQLDMDLWNEICGVGESIKGDSLTFSAIKTISQKEEYRFAHLSLQEFLYLDYRRACQDRPVLSTLLADPKFDNVLRIGFSSPDITSWLLNGITDFRFEPIDARQLSLLFELAKGHTGLRSLVITLHDGIRIEDLAEEIAELRAFSVRIIHLNNAICLIRPETTILDLSQLDITDDGCLFAFLLLLVALSS